jgi:hypothetical protein
VGAVTVTTLEALKASVLLGRIKALDPELADLTEKAITSANDREQEAIRVLRDVRRNNRRTA